jgi:hypothetical protein
VVLCLFRFCARHGMGAKEGRINEGSRMSQAEAGFVQVTFPVPGRIYGRAKPFQKTQGMNGTRRGRSIYLPSRLLKRYPPDFRSCTVNGGTKWYARDNGRRSCYFREINKVQISMTTYKKTSFMSYSYTNSLLLMHCDTL